LIVGVVVVGLRIVVDELDIPGSISSFGFIGNPIVKVEFFTGAIVALLGDPVILSYPAIIIKIHRSFTKLDRVL